VTRTFEEKRSIFRRATAAALLRWS